MPDLEQVNLAIAETGPLDEEILAVSRLGLDEWAIQFEPLALLLEYDVDQAKLGISGVIGTIPEARKVELLEALLSFNLLWRQTGGLRVGFSGSSEEAILMVELPEHQINPATIALVSANLAARTLLWRGMLSADAVNANLGAESLLQDNRFLV